MLRQNSIVCGLTVGLVWDPGSTGLSVSALVFNRTELLQMYLQKHYIVNRRTVPSSHLSFAPSQISWSLRYTFSLWFNLFPPPLTHSSPTDPPSHPPPQVVSPSLSYLMAVQNHLLSNTVLIRPDDGDDSDSSLQGETVKVQVNTPFKYPPLPTAVCPCGAPCDRGPQEHWDHGCAATTRCASLLVFIPLSLR